MDIKAILPFGGDQVLQRPPEPPSSSPLVWPRLRRQALRGALRFYLAQAKALATGWARRGGGCPRALWSSGAELGPKAVRHASDHKHVWGGGKSLFLEYSKTGDFSELVQPLAPVPPALSRATVRFTQAPPTDSEAQPPTPSQAPPPHTHSGFGAAYTVGPWTDGHFPFLCLSPFI